VKFRIRYIDPATGADIVTVRNFEDTPSISAQLWAEDWAYMAADKGWYEIVEVKARKEDN
jgi:hypothetical protein